MFRGLLVASLLLIASAAPSWADDLVATKPGLVCASADALARLTLPGGSSRTAQDNPAPADLALKQSGGCTDITIGMRVHVETARHNTSIVTYTAPDGQAVTAYVPNVDFEHVASAGSLSPETTPPLNAQSPASSGERTWYVVNQATGNCENYLTPAGLMDDFRRAGFDPTAKVLKDQDGKETSVEIDYTGANGQEALIKFFLSRYDCVQFSKVERILGITVDPSELQ